MLSTHRLSIRFIYFLLGIGLLIIAEACDSLRADQVVLHLKSGDVVSGTILTDHTNEIVISNAWAKTLSVPVGEIAKREIISPPPQPPAPTPPPAAPVLAQKKPAPTPQTPAQAPTVAKPAAPKGTWHGNVTVGADALFSTANQQDYFGKLNLTYEQAYRSNPQKFFRNTSQLEGEYKKTDGLVSANRSNINNKSDFDIFKLNYGYVSGGAGFDYISKINSKYQAGAGIGRHMFRTSSFAMNSEGGLDYQTQNRSNASSLSSFYGRLAEDLTWKIRKNLTFTQKIEFYSNLEQLSQYRFGLNGNLSYGFWQNLSLNLTADENYTTEVAPGVRRDEFELRLTLGMNF